MNIILMFRKNNY